MILQERLDLITQLLHQKGVVNLQDLVETVQASEATVRRDLSLLEDQGLLKRVHGGAELLKKGESVFKDEIPFESRKGLLLTKKKMIGKAAADLCTPEETIIIDGGSTTYQMVHFLRTSGLKVLTNSFAIADYLVKHTKNTVIISGGVVFPDSQVVLDPFNEDIFRNYSVSKVFMGVGGIDGHGATNTNLPLIQAERAMIAHGRELVVLADSTKFNTQSDLRLCGLDRISILITDEGIQKEQVKMLEQAGVKIIVASES